MDYSASIYGLLVLCLVPLLLAGNAGRAKGAAGLPSGPVPDPGDDNPLHRIDRAHLNWVESLTAFVVPALLAMQVAIGPGFLAALVWLYVLFRLLHLFVYLRGGAAARGGSLRTGLYMLGMLVNVVLIGATGWAAWTGTI